MKSKIEEHISKMIDIEDKCNERYVRVIFINLIDGAKTYIKKIPYSYLSDKLVSLDEEFGAVGLGFRLKNAYISDYFSFIKSVFKPFSIENKQYGEAKGHPDFILKNEGESGYIEYKSDNDNLSMSQLTWMVLNKDKEVWIMNVVDSRFESDKSTILRPRIKIKEAI